MQLDKEDEALGRARLALADERLHAEPVLGDTAAAGGAADTRLEAMTGPQVPTAAGGAGAGDEDEVERERELRRQQAAAEAAAREEEAKLRRAQAAVRAQMARVSALEKSIR